MKTQLMDKQEHLEKHRQLHLALDELSADYLANQFNEGKLLSNSTIMDLMKWNFEMIKQLEGEIENDSFF